MADSTTLSTRLRQPAQLALLSLCDGTIVEGFTGSVIFLVGHVLSRRAVNPVTLQIQKQLETHRLAPVSKTPKILIVDGVWVEIQ
jgi:hypothetical protein